MKAQIAKFIFFTVIAFLLIIAIYIMYNGNNQMAVDIKGNTRKEILEDSISIGIVNMDTLNPLLTKHRDVQYILKLVYLPLLDITKEFELTPSLATEWSKLDGKTYLIKLKENKLWQDGKLFTADDVKFTIESLKNSWTDSLYYDNVKNIKEVVIIDKYTIKLFLEDEIEFFEYKLLFPILPKHQYSKEIEEITEKPIGTGEYSFKEITDQKITLINQNAKTKELDICIYDNTSNLYADFSKKHIDIVISSNINIEEYIGTMGYKKQIIPDREFDYILINRNNEVLESTKTRQAIDLAIDKKQIIYDVFKKNYCEADFPENKSKSEESSIYNPNKAKEILLSDGWEYRNDSWYKNGKKLYFKIAVNSLDESRKKVVEIIKEQLELIGIKADIVSLNKNNYEYALKNNYYDLIITGNILPIEPNYKKYFKENGKLLEEICTIDNKEIKKKKMEELKVIYKEEVPFISLYSSSLALLLNANIKGDFEANWYNLFYDINKWYAVKEK